ncbi:MAG TPA: sigma-54-dependent Fis family transcriptional regulator [Desulfonauticus sp.]|jgi:two-component system NtrC family response regulator|nr:MAG: Two component, sigma54 specific, transcriptional regulator, Fis family [Desulfonauticus sp. 38_4375]MDK2921647.1 hypothetical protein [Desulfonauticus sp.]HCO12098.1 sigma-54-dependent Fis family transcriptional regulator [Desulfonauticus sp.]
MNKEAFIETTPCLLVVDDEASQRLLIKAVMEEEGWLVKEASNGLEALNILDQENVQVILADLKMPKMDGLELLHKVQSIDSHLPVILLTAFGTVDLAVEAMKKGAFDFLTKPTDIEELKSTLNKAYTYFLASSEKYASGFHQQLEIIGQSKIMQQLIQLVRQVAPSEANILITGESGTGKELVANALHKLSLRAKEPLIKVNCASLPDNLLESELFGYVKGAFTGAYKDKPGRFLLAHKGTLFLDEIGEMPLNLQSKLLRALQEKTIEPLGAIHSVPVDVRFICATNKDLKQEVEKGNFREDLYFRINVIEIHLPPLRERKEDIPLLVNHFLKKLGDKNRKKIHKVSPEFLEQLTYYDWPGNVRELENILERAIILCPSDTLEVNQLPPHLLPQKNSRAIQENLEEAEKKAIIEALKANNGHREKTAQALGISRRTLQYKLKKYGLTKKR